MKKSSVLISFLIVIMVIGSVIANAQISEVYIGVNGLTCSQCSRSVEMSLRKLPFVNEVSMSLEQTEGKITFYGNKKIDISKIAQAVMKAGFSLRFLKAEINLDKIKFDENNCFDLDDYHYQMINTNKAQMSGNKIIQFIGPKFMSKTDVKKWQPLMRTNSNQTYYFVTVM